MNTINITAEADKVHVASQGDVTEMRIEVVSEAGIPTQPFRTVTSGYNLAWENTRLKIKPRDVERLTFSKPMSILAEGGTVTIGR